MWLNITKPLPHTLYESNKISESQDIHSCSNSSISSISSNHVWSSAYHHIIVIRATIESSSDPYIFGVSGKMGEFLTRINLQEWAPDTGVYTNEDNYHDPNIINASYETSYDRLIDIRRKYDST
jgi:hypothetical protein